MMKHTCLILGLIVLACIGGTFAVNARNNSPVFRVDAVPVTVKNRSGVRLTVTNISKQDQLFWSGTGDCTNVCWKTGNAAVQLEGVMRAHAKTCLTACVHHVTLRPGKTYSISFRLAFAAQVGAGRRMLKFAAVQPPLKLVEAMDDPQHKIPPPPYSMRVFWSEPVAFNLSKQTR